MDDLGRQSGHAPNTAYVFSRKDGKTAAKHQANSHKKALFF
jgi:hypothetical protein